MNLLKLLGWEVERLTKPYLILITLLVVTQFAWLGVFLWSEKNMYEEMRRAGTPDYTLTFGNYLGGTPFILSIGVAVTAMVFFSFWIWYRDFQGRGTFMMRLLLMPQQRMLVFGAKLVTMMLMILGLFSGQRLFHEQIVLKHAIRLIATPTHKEQLLHIPNARGAESVQGPGPRHHRESSEPSDLEGRMAPD